LVLFGVLDKLRGKRSPLTKLSGMVNAVLTTLRRAAACPLYV